MRKDPKCTGEAMGTRWYKILWVTPRSLDLTLGVMKSYWRALTEVTPLFPSVLRMKPRDFKMLGEYFNTELKTQPWIKF